METRYGIARGKIMNVVTHNRGNIWQNKEKLV